MAVQKGRRGGGGACVAGGQGCAPDAHVRLGLGVQRRVRPAAAAADVGRAAGLLHLALELLEGHLARRLRRAARRAPRSGCAVSTRGGGRQEVGRGTGADLIRVGNRRDGGGGEGPVHSAAKTPRMRKLRWQPGVGAVGAADLAEHPLGGGASVQLGGQAVALQFGPGFRPRRLRPAGGDGLARAAGRAEGLDAVLEALGLVVHGGEVGPARPGLGDRRVALEREVGAGAGLAGLASEGVECGLAIGPGAAAADDGTAHGLEAELGDACLQDHFGGRHFAGAVDEGDQLVALRWNDALEW